MPTLATPYRLRDYATADAAALLHLFRDTVRRVNCRDYLPEQIQAWASDQIELAAWTARFEGHVAYVVEQDSSPVGFADMSPSGYLDRLFVSADHPRRGIATMLVQRLVQRAAELGIERISTEASITAKPFFLAQGFEVLEQQTVDCRGEQLVNFKMVYVLTPTPRAYLKSTKRRQP